MPIFLLIFSILLFLASPANATDADADFSAWLDQFRAEAEKQGISARTLDIAFANAEVVDKVIELDQKQPENKITLDEYLQKTVVASRIKNGREELSQNRELLEKILKKYQVPASVIVALWGMETSYGENTGDFSTINALATLAYEGRRAEFFRKELANALWMMELEKLTADDFRGSWAGAFGQCQFMPSSFLKYAVDFDGDGKRDIWENNADIFASIANYLHSEGWDEKGEIIEGSNNFKVLLKWNRSRYFATAVGQLAKKIEE